MTQREQLEKLRAFVTNRIARHWSEKERIEKDSQAFAAEWDAHMNKYTEAHCFLDELNRLLAEPAPVEKHEPRPLTIEEEEQVYADSQGQHEDDSENPFR